MGKEGLNEKIREAMEVHIEKCEYCQSLMKMDKHDYYKKVEEEYLAKINNSKE